MVMTARTGAPPSDGSDRLVGTWRHAPTPTLPVHWVVALFEAPVGAPPLERRAQGRHVERRLVADAANPGGAATSRSYAGRYGVCAVAWPGDARPGRVRIGVDIERDGGPDRFGDEEIASVRSYLGLTAPPDPDGPRAAFFGAWTRFEARGKALGTGIVLAPEEIDIRSRDHAVFDLTTTWRDMLEDGQTDRLYGAVSIGFSA